MGIWSRSPPALTHEYQESVANRVRDILTGEDQSPRKQRNKAAIKALQRPEALAGVIEILKTMPDPSDDDKGVDIDLKGESGREAVKGHEKTQDKNKREQEQNKRQALGVQRLFNGKDNNKTAATSAATATLALRKPKQVVREKEETTIEVNDKTETMKTTKTVVRFHPSKETVSSQA
ncbi:hypothetical protein BGZ65_003562, partial [Modicella reniformis]